jgi:hypothetical protein
LRSRFEAVTVDVGDSCGGILRATKSPGSTIKVEVGQGR